MRKKQKPLKKQRISNAAIIIIIAIIVLGILLFKELSITGKVILSKETIFSDNLNLEVNESGTYEWQVKNPGNIKSLKMSGSVTSNGTARVYIEKNGTRQLLFDSTKQLFDININVLPEYKSIFQGEEILIQIELINLRGFGSGDVNVKYSIKDANENLVASEEETIFIETQAKFVRKLLIPAEINPGTYIAFVEVSTDVVAGTGSDTFEVKSKYKYPQELKYYLIGVAAVVALAIVFILSIYGLKALKKKQKIAELREKIPEEKVQKLEKELKALETAYKAGFISKESYEKDKKRIEEKIK